MLAIINMAHTYYASAVNGCHGTGLQLQLSINACFQKLKPLIISGPFQRTSMARKR